MLPAGDLTFIKQYVADCTVFFLPACFSAAGFCGTNPVTGNMTLCGDYKFFLRGAVFICVKQFLAFAALIILFHSVVNTCCVNHIEMNIFMTLGRYFAGKEFIACYAVVMTYALTCFLSRLGACCTLCRIPIIIGFMSESGNYIVLFRLVCMNFTLVNSITVLSTGGVYNLRNNILAAGLFSGLEVSAVSAAVGSVNNRIFSVLAYLIPFVTVLLPVWHIMTERCDILNIPCSAAAANVTLIAFFGTCRILLNGSPVMTESRKVIAVNGSGLDFSR